MLEELRIAGLGVIEDAELPLAPGLTVVTGETGAGKTMVVNGLSLLLGARADASLVRAGAPRAVVEGRLRVDPRGAIAARVAEAGADLDDDGALIVTRTVSAEGRSRAHVGGRTVPVALLAELGDDLVTLHGQADQLRLHRPGRQRAAVDSYAGAAAAEARAAYRRTYARLREVETLSATISATARERAREADALRFGLAEVEAVAPIAGEDVALAAEEERLAHADALRSGAERARQALSADEDVAVGTVDALSALGVARRAIQPVEGHDPGLSEVSRRLQDAAYGVADVAADLAAYASSVDVDPQRLVVVQERRAALARLTRRYGATPDDVLAWARDAAARLGELDGDDDRLERLRTERQDLRAELGTLAARLSAARTDTGARLASAVTAELAALAMPQARLEVAVRRITADDGLAVGEAIVAFGPEGVDEVELLLTPHQRGATLPLDRGASGGELSRVMLALEVVLAGSEPRSTLVFDEVDAGVGGRAAVEVGHRLARLAEAAQVVVVTHLPQIAAFADAHLRVEKADDGRVVRSGVTWLDEAGRVRELSRMLAGMEASATAHAHAEELLASAAAGKPRRPGDA